MMEIRVDILISNEADQGRIITIKIKNFCKCITNSYAVFCLLLSFNRTIKSLRCL